MGAFRDRPVDSHLNGTALTGCRRSGLNLFVVGTAREHATGHPDHQCDEREHDEREGGSWATSRQRQRRDHAVQEQRCE